jgi:hypothetical protein
VRTLVDGRVARLRETRVRLLATARRVVDGVRRRVVEGVAGPLEGARRLLDALARVLRVVGGLPQLDRGRVTVLLDEAARVQHGARRRGEPAQRLLDDRLGVRRSAGAAGAADQHHGGRGGDRRPCDHRDRDAAGDAVAPRDRQLAHAWASVRTVAHCNR